MATRVVRDRRAGLPVTPGRGGTGGRRGRARGGAGHVVASDPGDRAVSSGSAPSGGPGGQHANKVAPGSSSASTWPGRRRSGRISGPGSSNGWAPRSGSWPTTSGRAAEPAAGVGAVPRPAWPCAPGGEATSARPGRPGGPRSGVWQRSGGCRSASGPGDRISTTEPGHRVGRARLPTSRPRRWRAAQHRCRAAG